MEAEPDGDVDPAAARNVSGYLRLLLPLLSPLNWFSWLIGAGAAGSLATLALVPEPLAGGVALGGAWGFSRFVVRPIWNTIFSFASNPAGNLQSCLLQEVVAVTAFNPRGEGIIRIEIDGHSEDILARLINAQLERGIKVKKGDRLLIEDVNLENNSCRVSRILS
jgi:hypothetical protein